MVSSTPVAPSVAQQLDATASDADSQVIRAISEYKREAQSARVDRLRRNARNRDVFLSRQDWSHKREGQSQQFLPKVPVSVEQMSSFVKRGLVMYGDWFSVDLDPKLQQIISEGDVVNMLRAFLDNLWSGNELPGNFPTLIGDAVKNGLLESLMIFKVHGGIKKCRRYHVEKSVELDGSEATYGEPNVEMEEYDEWRLRIDLVRPEDYYPDPSGAGLYEIHRVERDLHEVVALGKSGIYKKSKVDELVGTDYGRPLDEERKDTDRDQNTSTPPGFRKRVVIDEFWGTLLDSDGTILHRNCVCAVANEKYVIRPPEANPFWHQRSPFVAVPLVRVPWSVWHKALYDDASELNLAINEMFNLMLDGGMAAVWGIKQVKLKYLEDPGQASGGIPQGATLAVNDLAPPGEKVVETVAQGQVPQDAMAIFEFLNREFGQAALTNELKLGSIPTKQVRATEVIEASQSQAVTLDGMISDIETNCMDAILEMCWLNILQNADTIPEDVLLSLTNRQTAAMILQASPAERFATFAGFAKFKARGLSQTMNRAKDFQKMMALLQVVSQSPVLLQEFMMEYSPKRTLKYLMKSLNINPKALEKSEEEKAQSQQEVLRTAGAANLTNAPNKRTNGASTPGEPGMSSEINQQANPATGFAPNA